MNLEKIESHLSGLKLSPAKVVLAGSQASEHNLESDSDFLGLHLMDTWDVLDFPRDKEKIVTREQLSLETSLASFEVGRIPQMFHSGSPELLEILHLPSLLFDSEFEYLFFQCKGVMTQSFGKSMQGMARRLVRHDKYRRSKKYALLTYYKLLQISLFYFEEEFFWKMGNILDYGTEFGLKFHEPLFNSYMKKETRRDLLTEEETSEIRKEVDSLILNLNSLMGGYPERPGDLSDIEETIKSIRVGRL